MLFTETFTTFAKLSAAALVVLAFTGGLLVGRATSLFSFVPCQCGGAAAPVDSSGAGPHTPPVDSLRQPSGGALPFHENAQGIDVSQSQGVIDWPAVRGAGIAFAYARASRGTSPDTNFGQYWREIAQAGLYRGAYHFFHANIDPIAQAQFFVKTVGTMNIDDLPPMLDVESQSLYGVGTDTLRARVRRWLAVVEDSTGKRPVVYSNADFYRAELGGLAQYPLWIADFSEDPQDLGRLWTFWQYTDSGRVAGIQGAVDRDVFRGPLDSLRAFIDRANVR